MVEVATVGREGAVGITAVMDDATAESTTLVQGESEICYRIGAATFRREIDRRGAFYELVTRYLHAYVALIMQSTAEDASRFSNARSWSPRHANASERHRAR